MIRFALLERLEQRTFLSRYALIGDYTAGTPLRDVSSMMKGWTPDSIVTLGDNSYSDPTIDDTAGQYFHDYISPYFGSYGAGSTVGNRFFPALGNHDYDNGLSQYLNFFTLPGNERYYSVTRGNVQFFILNSRPQEPDGTSSTSTQAQWLKNALAASSATWKLVVTHDPPYTSGTQGNITYMQWPYQQWGATAVFSGNEHSYERILKNGFPYFINGLGGAAIVPANHVEPGSQVRYSSNYGAMLLDAGDTSLNLKFISRSGLVVDDYTITKTAPPPPPNTTFISTGSSWKYLDNGSNQGTAWRASGFADSTWKTGNAQLGYGDGDEATVVSYGPSSGSKFVTTYFRKSFTVADASAVSSLNLQLLRDDGAVVYLNGTEIYRNNMPGGTIGYSTLASTTIGGADESTFYTASINPSLLTSGSNVIAVEIHQGDVTSSDISFDFKLEGATSGAQPTLPAAPSGLTASATSYAQVNLNWTDNSTNESGFRIERSTNGGGFSEIGTVGAGVTSYTDNAVSGSTSYSYRVRAYNAAGNSGYSNTDSVTTPAAPNFVYLSDLAWVGTPTSGYGPVEKDKSNGGTAAGDGRTITLNGVTYAKGLGAHANSSITYNLGGAYTTFLSDVGVDDEESNSVPASIVFQVFLDGVKAFDSGVMTSTTATKSSNLNVSGKSQLRLVITDAGDGIDYDHGDWAGARLVTGAPSPAASPTLGTSTLDNVSVSDPGPAVRLATVMPLTFADPSTSVIKRDLSEIFG